ncbi:hypothetical protein BHUM_05532 [Candidatus Burkholderia humilis]|nr:hypothetical protein BHUM_05532 [Candidatus Burkholderia humilis]
MDAAKTEFDAWPSALRVRFDGTFAHTDDGFTALLSAVDDTQRIRSVLLSAGELFAPDAHRLCFALWPASRTAWVIIASARATLSFVADDAFYQVQLNARHVALDDAPLACFVATIENGEAQRVGYARLTSGITFELADAEPVRALARTARMVEKGGERRPSTRNLTATLARAHSVTPRISVFAARLAAQKRTRIARFRARICTVR